MISSLAGLDQEAPASTQPLLHDQRDATGSPILWRRARLRLIAPTPCVMSSRDASAIVVHGRSDLAVKRREPDVASRPPHWPAHRRPLWTDSSTCYFVAVQIVQVSRSLTGQEWIWLIT